MVHGSLEDDGTRAAYLAETLGVASAVSFPAARERRLDLLGDLVEEHLDVDRLLRARAQRRASRPARAAARRRASGRLGLENLGCRLTSAHPRRDDGEGGHREQGAEHRADDPGHGRQAAVLDRGVE